MSAKHINPRFKVVFNALCAVKKYPFCSFTDEMVSGRGLAWVLVLWFHAVECWRPPRDAVPRRLSMAPTFQGLITRRRTALTDGSSSTDTNRNTHSSPSVVIGTSSSPPPSLAEPGTRRMLLCRVCKQYYDPSINHDRACRHHPKSFTGDSKRKGDWSNDKGRGELVRMWWCCGEEDSEAPGCRYDRHRSYDDE